MIRLVFKPSQIHEVGRLAVTANGECRGCGKVRQLTHPVGVWLNRESWVSLPVCCECVWQIERFVREEKR